MTESCKVCLGSIKQEEKFDLNKLASNLQLEISSDDAINITENPVACMKCKVEIDETYQLHRQNGGTSQLHPHLIKQEFVEDSIKTEVIVEDHCVVFNTDIPVYIEERLPLTILYCFHCNYGTNDKQNLTDHIIAHRFKCDQCNCTTPDKSMLETHQQMGCLQCRICRYTCTEMSSLNEHMSTHTASELDENEKKYQEVLEMSEDLFECYSCHYKTNSKVILELHLQMCLKMQIAHDKTSMLVDRAEKLFKCKLCDYVSKYSQHFQNHLLKHSRKQPFCCDKCDYKTYYNYNFKIHKNIHPEEKPFKCSLCEFSTRHVRELNVHLMRHEPSYKCDKCDYKAYIKSMLTVHKNVHLEEKLFKCPLCDFNTKYSSYLKSHLNIHSDGRKFNCVEVVSLDHNSIRNVYYNKNRKLN